MIKNYFPAGHFVKTAWRTITKNRVFSLINILGLTIGLSTCMIVATVVIDDLSYDRQWSKGNNLYRIIAINKLGDDLYDRSSSSFQGLVGKLESDFPEVKAAGTMYSYKNQLRLNDADPNGVEVTILSADTVAWQMLDIDVLAGDPRKYIEGSRNIVISESFSKKFFPGENPVGKIIYDVPSYTAEPKSYLITGIIKDIPTNSVLRAEAIFLHKPRQADLHKKEYGTFSENWVLFNQGTEITKFTEKLNKWYSGYVETKQPYQFEFQPIKSIYLGSDFAGYQMVKGDAKSIYIFSGVAFLLLVIACVNFMNLSTARAIQRLQETGVRKILGADRGQLVFQFLTEAFLFFVISTLSATLIYQMSIPFVERYLEHGLSQTFVSKYYLFAIVFAVIFCISILTGFYPAWIISGFKPSATLKGRLFPGNASTQHFVRKGLVVFQFSISIVVLIALIVVRQQVSFMNNKDIGYNRNNLLSIGFVSWDGKGETFKNELLRQPGVAAASITSWLPTRGAGYSSREIEDPNRAGKKIKVWYINGDPDLAQTLGLRLVKGRFLDRSFASDLVNQDSMMQMDSASYVAAATQQSSLITAYTAKLLHADKLGFPVKNAHTTPAGIVQDFNNESLKNPMQPVIIIAENSPSYGGMLIRIQPGFEQQVTTAIGKLWQQFFPGKLLDTKWVDDMLAAQYKAENKLQQLFIFFSGLSMFLASLGIFGLLAQAVAERVKEIGIRKVLGASVQSIVQLFSIDFLKLVIIAAAIASPVAWFFMSRWLSDFAYRVAINWWIFIIAGGIAVAVAMITMSFQTIRAAMANPVKSLRSE